MNNKAAFLRVGLLIVVGACAIIGLLLFLSGDRFRKGQMFETYFTESIQGLEIGAPIKFRGVSLGRVSKIGLVSAEYPRSAAGAVDEESYRLVYVRFTIEADRVGRMPDSESAARSGLRARVASQGITGLSYIELDFVKLGSFPEIPERPLPWTPVGDYIASVPSTLAQVQDAAQQLLAKFNKIDIEHLQVSLIALLDDVRRSVNNGDVHTLLARATGLIDTMEKTVSDADVRATLTHLNGLIAHVETMLLDANVPALMTDFRATSTALRDVVQGKEVRTLLTNAAVAADRFAVAAGKLGPVIAALEATARRAGEGTADLQQAIVPLLRDAQAAAANVRETTDALRQYPAGTILGGPPPRNSERPR